jgi:hypothetical protein
MLRMFEEGEDVRLLQECRIYQNQQACAQEATPYCTGLEAHVFPSKSYSWLSIVDDPASRLANQSLENTPLGSQAHSTIYFNSSSKYMSSACKYRRFRRFKAPNRRDIASLGCVPINCARGS